MMARSAALVLATIAAVAPAQAARYELGLRVRAFESAFEAVVADPAARERVREPLAAAVRSFFGVQLDEVARHVDTARLQLATGHTPDPAAVWAASLTLRPSRRLLDSQAPSLGFELFATYDAEVPQPASARLAVTLVDDREAPLGPGLDVAVTELPFRAELPLLGTRPGDHRLRIELFDGERQLLRTEQVLSFARRLDGRIATLAKVAQQPPTDSQAATARGLARLLRSLARGGTAETDVEAARHLREVEALAAGESTPFGAGTPGDFRLWLRTDAGIVATRVMVPPPATALAPGAKLPVVIARHGAGGSENLFFDAYGAGKIVRLCRERGWLLVAPRADLGRGASASAIVAALAAIYPIDRGRVFAVGHSMGAATLMGEASAEPASFRAIALLGGGGGSVTPSAALAKLPIFLAPGEHDFARPNAARLRDELRSAGVADLVYREYEATEHFGVVQVALADAFAFFDRVATATPPRRRPNVLVILSDDQGFADIGYHNPNVWSPNLDALAAGGVRFAQHYVQPQCTPTRVALMTGRYPSRFGGAAMQASNQPAFPLGTPTLASLFDAAGYDTFLVGKWHLGSSAEHGPNHFGFDSSYGALAGAVGAYDHRYRSGRFEFTWHRDGVVIEGGENGTHTTDLLAREAIRIIERDDDDPFLLYLPFTAVHTPLDERGSQTDRPTRLDPDDPSRWLGEDENPWFHDPDGRIQRERDPEKRLLLAAVHHLDHAVGEIVAALDRSGKRSDTLILFSSDNGPQGSWPGNAYPDDLRLTDFNQPLPMRGKKLDVYEGGIHVPGFANWPGRIEPGVRDDPTHIVDWFPTLAALIGQTPEPAIEWDGVDLGPLLFAGQRLPERELYWTWNPRIDRWALRRGDWKIVRYGREPAVAASDWQLYALADDPREQHDVGDRHPEVREALHRRFLAQRARDRQ
ncbi:MAG: sulfatase-like hydrolase/transferase [Planctomycetes bacterium]|nr:sulfatase-like hydrolase/transferase [Planctomycetota bacterium]